MTSLDVMIEQDMTVDEAICTYGIFPPILKKFIISLCRIRRVIWWAWFHCASW